MSGTPKIASNTLEVGVNDKGEVVMNHPRLDVDEYGVGHIVFSPQQAITLALILINNASKALEGQSRNAN